MHICILSISTSSDPVNKYHKTAQERFKDLLVHQPRDLFRILIRGCANLT